MRSSLVSNPIPIAWATALVLLLAAGATGDDGEAPSGPNLVFDQEEHNFGRTGQEQELEATFTYRNGGTEPVKGIRAIGDCGCYGVSLSETDLEPGQEGTLTVRFRTLTMRGRVVKRIRVLTSDTTRPPLKLLLKLDIVAGVILDPGRIWFSDVLLGTSPSKTVNVKWHAEAGKPFKVTSVEVPGYDFAIRTEAFEEGPWKGTAITLAFKEAPPLGIFSATALVRTDHPDYPRISLPVTANVTGKVWVQSRTVYFGWIPQGRPKRTSILIKPFSDDVNLGTVSAKSRNAKVKVKVERHPMREDRWWRLLVEVPADAKLGKVDDIVEVRTEVPGEEVTEIEVRGEVMNLDR